MHYLFLLAILLSSLAFTQASAAGPNPAASMNGQTGIINMPDARIDDDGVWRMGVDKSSPYAAMWSSISILPWLEVSGRITRIQGIPALTKNYGSYKDKAFDLKAVVLPESYYFPQVAVGIQDYFGTRLFGAEYLSLSRHYGPLDLSTGYGQGRIGGLFYGARYALPWENFSLVMESDANRYKHDPFANRSGADERTEKLGYGLEYRSQLSGLQLTRQGGELGFNVYVSLPLMAKDFVQKINEPPPYTVQEIPVSLEEWLTNPANRLTLRSAFHEEGFKNVRMHVEGKTFQVSLTHTRISIVGRAVGRAARIIALAGPRDLDRIEITYTLDDMPVLSYQFRSPAALRRYFTGRTSLGSLKNSVSVFYASPEYAERFSAEAEPDMEESLVGITRILGWGEEGEIGALKREGADLGHFRFSPVQLGTVLNDPSGFFHYDIYSQASYYYQFDRGLFFEATGRYSLAEDISKISQKSNSRLPHVRSDIVVYKQAGPARVSNLSVSRYKQVGKELYSRAMAGYYEDMFAGAGGQILYYPERHDWAIDLAMDAVQQREPESQFGLRPYRTVTTITSFHYRFPRYGVTTTMRVGRFLAKDEGVGFELIRRFRSGVEVGAWYTWTNGNDITTPGKPGSPYHDKGVYFSIPLASFLAKDTQVRGNYAFAPWSRDVGQMLDTPDLYRILDSTLLKNQSEIDTLSGLGN